jgi:hypothetical protein
MGGSKGERGGRGRKKSNVSRAFILKNDWEEMMRFEMYIVRERVSEERGVRCQRMEYR